VNGEGPTCEKCRHWGDELRASYLTGRIGPSWQARCLVDPARAAPPLKWQWETCARFAPELRPYPKEAA